MNRTHLITGVSGQDGVLLARLLLAEGGRVVGTVRPGSPSSTAMAPYLEGVDLVEMDVRDHDGMARLIADLRPDEVYNLAAISSVGRSWNAPEETVAINGQASADLLKALEPFPETRFLQAASVEETHGATDSPYAQGKVIAREATTAARDQGRFSSAAVLHIHNSVLRPTTFVARKVTNGVAEIVTGRAERLELGPLEVQRDWGNAADHVRAMRAILLADEPADYVVGTGVIHSLRDFVEEAFRAAGISDAWSYVDHDAAVLRPSDAAVIADVDGRPIQELGWAPKHAFTDTINRMVEVDIERIESGVAEAPHYLEDSNLS
ncbi:MAG: GDP-mannose 4,6-dehydratase [Marmoricola sp.]